MRALGLRGRHLIALIVALSLVTSCSGSGDGSVSSTDSPATTTPASTTVAETPATTTGSDTTAPAAVGSYRVAIIEIVPLDIIDELREGFKEAMASAGFVEGENVEYEVFNAQGEVTACTTIAQQLAGQDWSLVYVVGTGCVQAMYQENPAFPIVFGAMTDPVSAGMAADFDTPNPNTTGTSDMVLPDRNLELLTTLVPTVETVGTLGNPTEANTTAWMSLFEEEAGEMGLEIVNVPVQATADVQTAANSLVGRVDAIIAPPDNTVEPAIGSVIGVSLQEEIPLVTAKSNFAEEGALIGMGVDYFQLGLLNGEQAAQILNGTQPETLPVLTMESPVTAINVETAEAFGIEIPEEIRTAENVTLVGE